jgi:hypothetical protein
MIDRRTSFGGTATENVRKAITTAEKALDKKMTKLSQTID